MGSDQLLCRALHSLQIQFLGKNRDKPSFKHAGCLTVPKPVAIGLCFCMQPGMKPLRRILARVYADILRQIPAQLGKDLLAVHRRPGVEICGLPQGVNTGIRSAAAADLNGLPQDPGEGGFQLALNRIVPIGKPLPAPVAGAIVAQFQFDIAQRLSRSLHNRHR